MAMTTTLQNDPSMIQQNEKKTSPKNKTKMMTMINNKPSPTHMYDMNMELKQHSGSSKGNRNMVMHTIRGGINSKRLINFDEISMENSELGERDRMEKNDTIGNNNSPNIYNERDGQTRSNKKQLGCIFYYYYYHLRFLI